MYSYSPGGSTPPLPTTLKLGCLLFSQSKQISSLPVKVVRNTPRKALQIEQQGCNSWMSEGALPSRGTMTQEERNKVLADLKADARRKREKRREYQQKYYAEHKAQYEENRRRFKEAHPNYFKEYHKLHKEWWRKGGKYY